MENQELRKAFENWEVSKQESLRIRMSDIYCKNFTSSFADIYKKVNWSLPNDSYTKIITEIYKSPFSCEDWG